MIDIETPLSAAALRRALSRLAGPLELAADVVVDGAVDDVEAVEQIAALEELKNACAARQARLAVTFDASQAWQSAPATSAKACFVGGHPLATSVETCSCTHAFRRTTERARGAALSVHHPSSEDQAPSLDDGSSMEVWQRGRSP